MTRDEKVPDPRPNWRDPTTYAYTKNLTREAWAWEFLRRNPAYRDAWKESSRGRTPDETEQAGPRIVQLTRRSEEAEIWGLVSFRGSRLQRAFRRYCLAAGDFLFRLVRRELIGAEWDARSPIRHRFAEVSEDGFRRAEYGTTYCSDACRPATATLCAWR